MYLKVKKGGSICGPNNVIYKEGQVIPKGVLSPEQIKEHLRSGFLRTVSSTVDRLPTLEEIMKAGYGEDSAKKLQAELAQKEAEDAPGMQPESALSPEGKPIPVHFGKWDLDPEKLQGLDLDQLNVMVLERDPSIEEFQTVEEAIEWLSQDFAPEAPKGE